MVLDSFHTSDILGGDPVGISHGVTVNKAPEVHDAIVGHHATRLAGRPAVSGEFGCHKGTHGLVGSLVLRRSLLPGEQTLQKIGTAHDANHLAVAHDRDALHTVALHEGCNLTQGRKFVHGHQIPGHDVSNAMGVGTDVVVGQDRVV